MHRISQGSIGISIVYVYYFGESLVSINIERLGAAKQVHTRKQARQAQIMVAMQVADKNMVDTLEFQGITPQLHLGTFSTVN